MIAMMALDVYYAVLVVTALATAVAVIAARAVKAVYRWRRSDDLPCRLCVACVLRSTSAHCLRLTAAGLTHQPAVIAPSEPAASSLQVPHWPLLFDSTLCETRTSAQIQREWGQSANRHASPGLSGTRSVVNRIATHWRERQGVPANVDHRVSQSRSISPVV